MASRKYEQQVPVEVGNSEIVVDVTYTYTPGCDAVMYLRNGDPGYPAESPETELVDMKVSGQPIPEWFESAISETVSNWVIEHHAEPERD